MKNWRTKVKLFKMNDYDWIAAFSVKQAIEYHKELYASDEFEDEANVKEIRLISNRTGFWCYNDMIRNKDREKLRQISIKRNPELAKQHTYIPFQYNLRKLIKRKDIPYFAGTTEF